MGAYGSTWEAGGYYGAGNVAELVNSHATGTAVICGNARGVFEELAWVHKQRPDAVIFAVNDAGMFLPHVDHWVSLHVDNLGAWKQVRWLHPAAGRAFLHSIDKRPFVDYVWERLTPTMALSGYFAMQIAYIMGFPEIILCGCPGDATSRFFEHNLRERADTTVASQFAYGSGPTGTDNGLREQVVKEMKRLPDFAKRVTSMSGWTAEYFGKPRGGSYNGGVCDVCSG